jgi:hypothetical protein
MESSSKSSPVNIILVLRTCRCQVGPDVKSKAGSWRRSFVDMATTKLLLELDYWCGQFSHFSRVGRACSFVRDQTTTGGWTNKSCWAFARKQAKLRSSCALHCLRAYTCWGSFLHCTATKNLWLWQMQLVRRLARKPARAYATFARLHRNVSFLISCI